ARSNRTSMAVSAVTCRQAATARFSKGGWAGKGWCRAASGGMGRSAYRMRASPSAARPASAMSVTVVLRLVRAVDRHADVVRLLLGQLAEPDPERVQVQPGHLLVQVLGQRVHAGGVLVGLGEQLDLGDDLV